MNLNARAAARLLCVSEEKIYEWAKEGILPAYKVQEQLRFNRVELLEWASTRRMKVAPDLFEDERHHGNGGAFKLSRGLAAGGIHRDVAGTDGRTALHALIALLPLPEGVSRETVAALFAAREGVAPVGDGVAIPHARAPAVLPLAHPLVALGFLAKPVDMKARDGKPVGVLFVLFSPSIRVHLDVLAKLAAALSDLEFQALVGRRAADEQILGRLAALEARAAKAADARAGGPAP